MGLVRPDTSRTQAALIAACLMNESRLGRRGSSHRPDTDPTLPHQTGKGSPLPITSSVRETDTQTHRVIHLSIFLSLLYMFIVVVPSDVSTYYSFKK